MQVVLSFISNLILGEETNNITRNPIIRQTKENFLPSYISYITLLEPGPGHTGRSDIHFLGMVT